jgi:hypothetical protein
MFQFANSFNALFYIAFIKTQAEGCIVQEGGGKVKKIGASCLDELYIQLIVLIFVNFLKNFLELGIPYLKFRSAAKSFGAVRDLRPSMRVSESMSNEDSAIRDEVEEQVVLPPYVSNTVDGTFGDFLEVAVMFGYVTLFAVAFPLGNFLTYLSALLEISVDKFKLLNLVRRPMPAGAKNIGTWWTIFNITGIIAVFTNSAVLTFTAPTFSNTDFFKDNLYIPFMILVIIQLGFRSWIRSMIPSISEKYKTLIKRHENIVEVSLKGWRPIKKRIEELDNIMHVRIYCADRLDNAAPAITRDSIVPVI